MVIGITGSKGFIGSYLIKQLAARWPGSVRAIVRSIINPPEIEGVEVIQGDLLAPEDCRRFVDGLDTVVHLAHCHVPANSDIDQANDALLNMVPLLNLLQAARSAGRKPHFVYFSSGGVIYKRKQERIPYQESDEAEPGCSYGIQKLAAEHYLRLAAEREEITCSVLRVANAYGMPLSGNRMQGLIGVAITNVMHGKSVRVFGDLDNTRDYVHLSDIARIFEKVLVPRSSYTVLNVGSGMGHSVRDILAIIESTANRPMSLETLPDSTIGKWLSDWAVLDIGKARREFGWFPEVSIEEGIRFMIYPVPKSRED